MRTDVRLKVTVVFFLEFRIMERRTDALKQFQVLSRKPPSTSAKFIVSSRHLKKVQTRKFVTSTIIYATNGATKIREEVGRAIQSWKHRTELVFGLVWIRMSNSKCKHSKQRKANRTRTKVELGLAV